MLTGVVGKDSAEVEGPASGNEGQGVQGDTPEWDGEAWSSAEEVGSFILLDSPTSQSRQEAGVRLPQTSCQTSLPVTVGPHHRVGFQWLMGSCLFRVYNGLGIYCVCYLTYVIGRATDLFYTLESN